MTIKYGLLDTNSGQALAWNSTLSSRLSIEWSVLTDQENEDQTTTRRTAADRDYWVETVSDPEIRPDDTSRTSPPAAILQFQVFFKQISHGSDRKRPIIRFVVRDTYFFPSPIVAEVSTPATLIMTKFLASNKQLKKLRKSGKLTDIQLKEMYASLTDPDPGPRPRKKPKTAEERKVQMPKRPKSGVRTAETLDALLGQEPSSATKKATAKVAQAAAQAAADAAAQGMTMESNEQKDNDLNRHKYTNEEWTKRSAFLAYMATASLSELYSAIRRYEQLGRDHQQEQKRLETMYSPTLAPVPQGVAQQIEHHRVQADLHLQFAADLNALKPSQIPMAPSLM